MAGLLARERIIARPAFNRWLVPPASVAIHLCIGSVYAWSIYNPALIRTEGVVTPAAGDWSLSSVVWIFTVAVGGWRPAWPMGFGGGAIIGAPAKEYLLRFFYRAPDYLGTLNQLELVTEGGVRFARIADQVREIVVINANEVDHMIVAGPPGVYLAGTGSVGVSQTFFTLGVIYFLVMVAAAFSYRLPAPDWKPAGWTPPDATRREQKNDHRR